MVFFFLGLFAIWHKIILDVMSSLGNYYPHHFINGTIFRQSLGLCLLETIMPIMQYNLGQNIFLFSFKYTFTENLCERGLSSYPNSWSSLLTQIAEVNQQRRTILVLRSKTLVKSIKQRWAVTPRCLLGEGQLIDHPSDTRSNLAIVQDTAHQLAHS